MKGLFKALLMSSAFACSTLFVTAANADDKHTPIGEAVKELPNFKTG